MDRRKANGNETDDTPAKDLEQGETEVVIIFRFNILHGNCEFNTK